MVRSMTGYGRAEGIFNKKKVVCEIKSVNNRYADFNIRVPRHYGFLDEYARKYLSEHIGRGKVDLYIGIECFEDTDRQVSVNLELAKSYMDALNSLAQEFDLKDNVSISLLSRFGDIFVTERKDEDAEEIWQTALCALKPAVEQFISMREREGERMLADLREKSQIMLEMVDVIEKRSPESVKEYTQRLEAKIREVLSSENIDEARIITETAIFADKVAVNEETVRLRSHFNELETILAEEGAIGKKLDFLVQEINREINTIGSKANDIEIGRVVVNFKAELEKFREQVQNVE